MMACGNGDVQAPRENSRRADTALRIRRKGTSSSFHVNANCLSFCLLAGMRKNMRQANSSIPGARGCPDLLH